MREALAARSGRDFVTSTAPRRGGRAAAPVSQRALRFALVNRKALFGGALLLFVGGSIAVNATLRQERFHPAPLFGAAKSTATRTAAPALVPAHPPLPPARPVVAPAAAPVPALPVAPRASTRDSIADLIKGGETGAVSRVETRAPEAQRGVAAAQRALVALGYGPLASDGLMGRETKAAIERFERDRRIPVTGEFGARTVRELSLRSGLPLD